MSDLYIDVKVYGGSNIPASVIPEMVRLANQLQISVRAELNGVRTLARPGDDATAIVNAWGEALRIGRGMASANSYDGLGPASGELEGDRQ